MLLGVPKITRSNLFLKHSLHVHGIMVYILYIKAATAVILAFISFLSYLVENQRVHRLLILSTLENYSEYTLYGGDLGGTSI